MDKNKKFLLNTSLKIGDFIAEAGLSLLHPVASIPYNGIKKIIEVVKDCHQHKKDDRLHKFHMALLNECNNEEFKNKEFNIDDYITLVNTCLQDIEDEKSEIYGKFYKGLINGSELTKENKRAMILLIKDLSMSDIILLKEVYIRARYNIDRNMGNIREFINSNNLKINIARNKFVFHSLIDNDGSQITTFTEIFIKTIFDEEELKPENVGLKEWRNIKVIIISYRLNDSFHVEISTEIENYLYRERISSSIAALMRNNKMMGYMYNAGVLLLDSHEIENEYIKILNEFSEKRPLFIVNIEKNPNECIDRIKHEKLFYLDEPYNKSIKSVFGEIYNEYVGGIK